MIQYIAVACILLSSSVGQEAEPAADEDGPAATSRAAEELNKIAEKMREAPALSAEERLARAANTAGGIIRPLPLPIAIAATLLGFVMMLFGQRLLKIGIVLYLAALFGLAGREFGARAGDGWESLIGGGVGCVIGAGIALPLRALARSIIGGLAGAVLAVMIIQSFTSSVFVTLVAAAGGLVVSGILSFYFPKPLMIVGFSMFGAATASIGILSIAIDPVDGKIPYTAAHITGMILAAGLGVLFQSQLGTPEDTDESE